MNRNATRHMLHPPHAPAPRQFPFPPASLRQLKQRPRHHVIRHVALVLLPLRHQRHQPRVVRRRVVRQVERGQLRGEVLLALHARAKHGRRALQADVELAQVGPREADVGERAEAFGVLAGGFGRELVPVGDNLGGRETVSVEGQRRVGMKDRLGSDLPRASPPTAPGDIHPHSS